MTITDSPRTDAPTSPSAAIDAFVPFAAEVGARIAPYSAAHDRDGSFVTEAYDVLRESGYLRLAVPVECGGMGATIAQVAAAQAELARHCPSAALAVSMHLHITLFAAWRHRRGMPGAEALLRKVAEQGAVYVSTGGSDFTNPNGTATKVEGGYQVSGRKVFASQAPVGDVLSAFFTYEDPEQGRRVLAMGIPFAADGLEVVETWDSMGMRGTGSHDLQLTDVFVSDAQVMSNRPWGVVDPPLVVIVSHAMPVISAVYLGVAEAARDRLVGALRETDQATDAMVQRQVGLVDYKLRVARWSLFAAIAEVGDDPSPSMVALVAVMQAKRAVAEEAIGACDVILEAAGGMAYSRRAGLEQAVRDVRGIVFHPFTPEKTLVHADALALDQPIADN